MGVLAVACCGGALLVVRRRRSRATEVLQKSVASGAGGDGEATGSACDVGRGAEEPVLATFPTMSVLDVVRPLSSRRTSTEQESGSSRKPSTVRMVWTSRRESAPTGAPVVAAGGPGSARRRAEEPRLRLDSI